MADEYGGWDWSGGGGGGGWDWGSQNDYNWGWDPSIWNWDAWGGSPWSGFTPGQNMYQPEDPYTQFDPSAMFASNFQLPNYGNYGMEPQSPWARQYPGTTASQPDFGGGGGFGQDQPGLAQALNPSSLSGGGRADISARNTGFGDLYTPGGPLAIPQEGPTKPAQTPEERRHEEMMAMFSRGRGDVLGSGMSGSDIAGLSQMLLGAGGAIAGAVSGGPKPAPLTPQQQALIEAQIKQLEAQTERTLNPVFPPSKNGGGPSRPVLNMEALKARETALITAYTSEINDRYAKEEQRVLERANRIGSNPAGELARLDESKQRELKQLAVEARGQALKEALGFDTPSSTLSENLQ